jgi:3-dehydroquinate dehydratase-2
MSKILVINGPNLNKLGERNAELYGTITLKQLESALSDQASSLNTEVEFFQSNSEGSIVDFIQANAHSADGIVINPGALTHYGYSLRDSLEDSRLPIVEVHLTNIYSRESWRHQSVIAPIARAQVSGLGPHGYLMAIEYLNNQIEGK